MGAPSEAPDYVLHRTVITADSEPYIAKRSGLNCGDFLNINVRIVVGSGDSVTAKFYTWSDEESKFIPISNSPLFGPYTTSTEITFPANGRILFVELKGTLTGSGSKIYAAHPPVNNSDHVHATSDLTLINDSGQGGTDATPVASTVKDAIDAIKRWTGEYSQIGSWRVPANNIAYAVTGGSATTNLGSPSNVNMASGTYVQRKKRLRFPTTASPNTICGVYGTAVEVIGTDGYAFLVRFSPEFASATMVWFAGVQPGVPTAVDPASIVDGLGMGARAAVDANVQVLHNTVKIDLGSNFPAFTNGAVYEGLFVVVPGSSIVYFRIRRLDVPQVAVGSFSTAMPSSTTPLRRALWNYNEAGVNIFGAGMEFEVSVPL